MKIKPHSTAKTAQVQPTKKPVRAQTPPPSLKVKSHIKAGLTREVGNEIDEFVTEAAR